jgi:tetratricopeptide (TPR) repeat protein
MPVRRRLLGVARSLGRTAVPLLVRQLLTGDEARTSWAYYLLSEAAGLRALRALRELAGDPQVSEPRRALVLALLGELGAPLPATVRLLEDREPGRGSLADLARAIVEPAHAARAADELIARAEARGVAAVARDLVAAAGATAAPILDELALRDDVSPADKNALAAVRPDLGDGPTLARWPSRVWVGGGAGGQIVVAARPGRPRRVLVVHLGADGALARVTCDGSSLRAVRERLSADGYDLRRSTVSAVSARIAAAARAVCHAGARLPRPYYLGRDLVGLYDEHAAPPAPAAAETLFERGRELLDADEPERARGFLAAFARIRPEDAEARTWLGSCLLALAEVGPALAHLGAAVRLEPEDAVRRWNLAAAAKGCGRSGTAYLALRDYLRLARGRSPARRRRTARAFVRTYEQVIASEHPGVPAPIVARAEEPFLAACDHLEAGRTDDAIRGFQAVIERVPSHHPSWSNLGAAYLLLGQTLDARRCLETALHYRPDYELARQNLERVTSA